MFLVTILFWGYRFNFFSFLKLSFPFVPDSSLSLLTSLSISASSHPSVDSRCTSLSHSEDICIANDGNIRKSTLTSFQTHPPSDTLFLHPLPYYFHTLQTLPIQNSAIAKWYWKGNGLETLGRFCFCGRCRTVWQKIKWGEIYRSDLFCYCFLHRAIKYTVSLPYASRNVLGESLSILILQQWY
jgi:hypothetical protein